MKMITLFLPEKYLEMLDTLVAENLYPNRSEALRIATHKFITESVLMLKTIQAHNATAAASASATAAATATLSPGKKSETSILDETLGDGIPGSKAKGDPFDVLLESS